MNLNLSGRHALVCGASQGIGRASAIELARLGADVTVLARSEERLRELVAELPRLRDDQRHGHLAADMSQSAPLRARIEAVASAHPIQIVVNNSGGPPGGRASEATPEAFLDAFNQHLIAAQAVLQAALPGMQGAGYGRIVNIISTSVKEPIRNLGVSNTVRGAVASWAKTLAAELGGYGITVNNVLPGYTRTGRLDQILADRVRATGREEAQIVQGMLASVPAGRFAEPEDIAQVVAFLASPAAGYVNGVNVPVDGGRTLSL